ncbi:MAG: polyphosphate kinase 1 [Planctomycetota bacterium]
MASPPPLDLNDPKLFFNRELSLLKFNARVLAQAKAESTPLLERLRFLTICSRNLDEFFEVRVASLKQQVSYDLVHAGADGLVPSETLRRISEDAHELVEEQYRTLNDELLPALEREGIRVLARSEWTDEQRAWIRRFFKTEVLPVITPMALDPAHPFPRVINKGLSFVMSVEGKDAFGRSTRVAVLQVPRSLPRLIRLPRSISGGMNDFVMLSSVVHANAEAMFPGMSVTGCWQFRLTRNSDLWVDEEEVEDLLQALKGELRSRNYGEAVRLEVDANCDEEILQFLLRTVRLDHEDVYPVDGPVNLARLGAIYDLVDRPELKFAPFVPGIENALRHGADIFDTLRERDVLLHHPYESFAPVVDFLQRATSDPKALAIKMTLYRTDAESPLVESLIDAARAGKEVTCVVELRARFDEAANIDLATRLQEAGANVVYGTVGFKTHAKMLLVVRREGRSLKRYVHLGTGNYHPGTARAYTDYGLMTSSPELTEDVHKIFLQLTGLGKVTRLKKLLQSPFTLHKRLLELINDEVEHAKKGKPARIVAKVNSLNEPEVIRALYRASQAGVKVDLIVRGICTLRPGVPGVSENIRVRSIVGRFLEHSRIFYFHADGAEKTFLASADWMERNLLRRVETCFPIEDPALRAEVIRDGIDTYLADNSQAWVLGRDGEYTQVKPGQRIERLAQTILRERLAGLGGRKPDPGRGKGRGLRRKVG